MNSETGERVKVCEGQIYEWNPYEHIAAMERGSITYEIAHWLRERGFPITFNLWDAYLKPEDVSVNEGFEVLMEVDPRTHHRKYWWRRTHERD